MIDIKKVDLSFLLDEIAKCLDISDSLFAEAEAKYKAVGTWLGEGNSPLAPFSPQIFPQGSFLLGIVVKPVNDSDEYDIDLVFELAIPKEGITQKQLKELVGDRLKDHQTYRRMLDEEGRRCWTLLYAEGAQFHLDILPAIPDTGPLVMLKAMGVPQRLAETCIAITDNTRLDYDRITSDWPGCNPKGYAAWFRGRMLIRFEEMRKSLAEIFKAQMDSVPEYQIKTPLQRCIQLLKRHRDILFQNDPDNRPASIIITTLAAMAYNNEADLTDALINIVEGMPNFITCQNGVSWVANPVNPSENFADRWRDQDHPNREAKFRKWLQQVRIDIYRLLTCDDLDGQRELLAGLFGERVSALSVHKFKETHSGREAAIAVKKSVQPAVVPITRLHKPWGDC